MSEQKKNIYNSCFAAMSLRNAAGQTRLAWLLGIGGVLVVIGLLVWTGWREGESARMLAEATPAVQGPAAVGVILPISGTKKALGEELKAAAELAIEEINASGGVHGFPLEIVVEDSACDAKQAAASLKRMAESSHIKVFVGGVCTLEARALAQQAEELSVILIVPHATGDGIVEEYGNAFRIATTNSALATATVAYLQDELGVSRLLFFLQPREEQREFARIIKSSFESEGRKTMSLELGARPETYDALLTVLEDESINGVMILFDDPAFSFSLARAVHARATETAVLVQPQVVDFMALSGQLAEAEEVFTVGPQISFEDEDTVNVLERYRDRAGIPSEALSAITMYSGMYLVRDIFISVGLNVANMPSYLVGLSSWSGGVFKNLSFDEHHNPLKSIIVRKVDGGVLTQVKSY